MTAQAPPTIDQLDDLMVLIPLIMIVIALGLAFAVRIASRRRTGDGRASAGDPYFFPIGDVSAVDLHLIEVRDDHLRKILAAFGGGQQQVSASAPLRNENGGCQSPRSSAAVLTTFYMASADIPPADSNMHRRMIPINIERDDA